MRPGARSLISIFTSMAAAAVLAVAPITTGAQPAAAAVWQVTQTQQDPALEHARTGSLDEAMPVGPNVTASPS